MDKLKLCNVTDDEDVEFTYDSGVVSAVIGIGNFTEIGRFKPRNYWRLKSPDGKCLFNIDIDKANGSLIAIELTLFKKEVQSLIKSKKYKMQRDIGIPIFDNSLWQSETSIIDGLKFPSDTAVLINLHKDQYGPLLYNIPSNFLLQLNDAELRIELFSDIISRQVVVGDKLICEMNELDELCAITLRGIDIAKIKENI